MISKIKFLLFSSIAIGIFGCAENSETMTQEQAPLQFDDSGSPSEGVDLILTDVNFTSGLTSNTGKTVLVEARLTNIGATPYATQDLSMALEYSTTQSFERIYKTVLFDLSTTDTSDGSTKLGARTNPANLPSGSYYARLVVNPDWQLYFDNLPGDGDYSSAFRYLGESDYTNNYGDTVQFDVTSSVSCVEDSHEPNNKFGEATELLFGGIINAALCEDDLDLYSMQVDAGQVVAVALAYDSPQQFSKTRYLLLDSNYQQMGDGGVAESGANIQLAADVSGEYYLALYGERSAYSLSLSSDASLFSDPIRPFYTSETQQGPISWNYGQITLNRLSFDKGLLNGQVATCDIKTTTYHNEKPTGYATPSHFSGARTFRFADDDQYFVDGVLSTGWGTTEGDISNSQWYKNLYPGWAEIIGNDSWRYWERDGFSYVECVLK